MGTHKIAFACFVSLTKEGSTAPFGKGLIVGNQCELIGMWSLWL